MLLDCFHKVHNLYKNSKVINIFKWEINDPASVWVPQRSGAGRRCAQHERSGLYDVRLVTQESRWRASPRQAEGGSSPPPPLLLRPQRMGRGRALRRAARFAASVTPALTSPGAAVPGTRPRGPGAAPDADPWARAQPRAGDTLRPALSPPQQREAPRGQPPAPRGTRSPPLTFGTRSVASRSSRGCLPGCCPGVCLRSCRDPPTLRRGRAARRSRGESTRFLCRPLSAPLPAPPSPKLTGCRPRHWGTDDLPSPAPCPAPLGPCARAARLLPRVPRGPVRPQFFHH